MENEKITMLIYYLKKIEKRLTELEKPYYKEISTVISIQNNRAKEIIKDNIKYLLSMGECENKNDK